MSKRLRNRPDRWANAFALHCSDAPFQMPNGDVVDPRKPWVLPGQGSEPEPSPAHDPWGYEQPSRSPIPIVPTDCHAPA